MCVCAYMHVCMYRGACGVMVIVIGNGHANPSSNPGQVCLKLVEEKENSEFKPVKFCIKIDFVSYPAYLKVLVNTNVHVNILTRKKMKYHLFLLIYLLY